MGEVGSRDQRQSGHDLSGVIAGRWATSVVDGTVETAVPPSRVFKDRSA
jgi:hypothetical protein